MKLHNGMVAVSVAVVWMVAGVEIVRGMAVLTDGKMVAIRDNAGRMTTVCASQVKVCK